MNCHYCNQSCEPAKQEQINFKSYTCKSCKTVFGFTNNKPYAVGFLLNIPINDNITIKTLELIFDTNTTSMEILKNGKFELIEIPGLHQAKPDTAPDIAIKLFKMKVLS